MNHNCHARSKQNRNNISRKTKGRKPLTEIKVLPNDNKKPPSHVWKRLKLKK